MECSIEPTYDEKIVKRVLFNDEIWQCIKEDNAQKASFVIDFKKNVFLRVVAEKQTVGLYIVHAFNGTTLQIHANILPEFRDKYATYSAKAVLKYIDQNFDKKYRKLIALIPRRYANVYRFTCKQGFVDEGLISDAYFKDDVLDDIHLLGLKRFKIQELINGVRQR